MLIGIVDEVPDTGIEIAVNGNVKNVNDWPKLLLNPERLQHKYYFCRYCDGYIEGVPSQQGEHSGGMLAGQNGHHYLCLRCQRSLEFIGKVF
jgi:hypothetical protein